MRPVRESDSNRARNGVDLDGFKEINDVHGHADRLVALLEAMNYRKVDGVWRHPERTAVFVGDLVDRGKQQLDSVNIVRSMIEADTAKCVMGNHEFNAIAYVTFDPARSDHCRSRLGGTGASMRATAASPRRSSSRRPRRARSLTTRSRSC